MITRKKWLIPAIVAAIVVVVALILIIPRLGGSMGKPDDYYHKVELKGLKNVSESAANYYGNLLAAGEQIDDVGVTGSAELSLSKEFFDLIEDYVGEDFSWLNTVRVEYEVNNKDDQTGTALTLKLNKDKLATANLVMDREEEQLYIQVPEISKNYLGADLEDLTGSILGSLRRFLPSSVYWTLRSVLSDTNEETSEQISKVLAAMPTKDQFKKLLDKYLEVAINSIEDVERDKDTLSAGDVSNEYTTLTYTINQKVAMKIAENVLTELKKDKDVEGYIKNIAKAIDEDGDDAYEDFIEELDDALEDLEDAREDKDSNNKQKITMTVYVDGKGNIVGREIKANFDMLFYRNANSNVRFRYATPTKGGNLGIDISLKVDSETIFSITGSGKLSGSTLSAETVLKVQGSKLAEINLDKVNGAKLKEGYFSGVITLKPSAELVSMMDLPSAAERIVKKLSLSLDADNAKNSTNVKLIINYDDTPYVTLALAGKSASAKKVTPVKDYLDDDEWLEELDSKDLTSFVKDLKKTDIPSEYLEELEDLIDRLD